MSLQHLTLLLLYLPTLGVSVSEHLEGDTGPPRDPAATEQAGARWLWLVRIGLYLVGTLTAWFQSYSSGRRFILEGGTEEEKAVWRARVHDYADSLAMSLLVALMLAAIFFVMAITTGKRGGFFSAALDLIAVVVTLLWAHDALMTLALAFT